MEFVYKITERARVAFYLIVSEKVFEGIDVNQDEYPFVREVLNKCWNWLGGRNITHEEL
ncbi:MAG TPA: Imm6 family immunity protein [Clostridia bacterium]